MVEVLGAGKAREEAEADAGDEDEEAGGILSMRWYVRFSTLCDVAMFDGKPESGKG